MSYHKSNKNSSKPTHKGTPPKSYGTGYKSNGGKAIRVGMHPGQSTPHDTGKGR